MTIGLRDPFYQTTTLVQVAWSLLTVALLWGISNPFMKRGSQGLTNLTKTNSVIRNFFNDFYFLLKRPLYLIAFAVNISGSVLYYYSLSNQQISQIVTITNSLTFLVTTVTSKLLGEEGINKYTYLGMLCVLVGVAICVKE